MLISQRIPRLKARLLAPLRKGAGRPSAVATALALLALAPLAAGCNPQALAQQATATAAASVATPTPEAASTATPSGTETPRPIPTGTPPADPTTLFNAFDFMGTTNVLVKRDTLTFGKTGVPDMLMTLTGPDEVITGAAKSALAVIAYDPTYREWNLAWQSEPRPGTAGPLPAANRGDGYSYNGGDILRLGKPILVLRTTSNTDNRSHLFMWSYDPASKTGAPIKVASASGGAAEAGDFSGDLDVKLADLDNDGIYEVIADNLASVQTWKWDGEKFKPEARR